MPKKAVPEYIEKLVQFLNQETSWNSYILSDIQAFLEVKNPSNKEIDSLLMSVTKRVETKLKETLAIHLGNPVPRDKSYGVKLLDYAVSSHLIASKDEPIYSLISLLIKVPRNTTHHTFSSFPYKTTVMFLSEANEAIEQIESLTKSTYVSHLNTNYDNSKKKIET